MPTTYPMPIQEAVRDMLGDLVGRGIAVDKTSPLELEDDTVGAVSDLITDDGNLAVVLVADLALVAALGASLTMVPAVIVQESVRKNRFEEEALVENYGEIVNIISRLFNSASTPHLRYHTTYLLPGEVPPEVSKLRENHAARRTFAVTVEGYGDGKLELSVG